jgi:tyrosinase
MARRSTPAPSTPPRRGRRGLGPPKRPSGPAKTYTSPPVAIGFAGPDHRFVRADLEIHGIDHGEASYEGRVFFNNPKADAGTPRTPESGYAGSFHIFGHGGCFGDAGHCEVDEHARAHDDRRPPHPLTPANKRLTVTEPLQRAAKTGSSLTITVVPVVTAANELCDTSDVFRFDSMRFVTYNP